MSTRKVWRLDALHDLDGAFCRYFLRDVDALIASNLLQRLGWHCSTYAELVPVHCQFLIYPGSAYPLIDTPSICEMLDSKLAELKR